jgi:hypothetical protein
MRLGMGFYFRKRLGLGPLALNFSKSRIGIQRGSARLSDGMVITSAKIRSGYFETHAATWPVADD